MQLEFFLLLCLFAYIVYCYINKQTEHFPTSPGTITQLTTNNPNYTFNNLDNNDTSDKFKCQHCILQH